MLKTYTIGILLNVYTRDSDLKFVGNKAKGQILKQSLQEKKAPKFFQKTDSPFRLITKKLAVMLITLKKEPTKNS